MPVISIHYDIREPWGVCVRGRGISEQMTYPPNPMGEATAALSSGHRAVFTGFRIQSLPQIHTHQGPLKPQREGSLGSYSIIHKILLQADFLIMTPNDE